MQLGHTTIYRVCIVSVIGHIGLGRSRGAHPHGALDASKRGPVRGREQVEQHRYHEHARPGECVCDVRSLSLFFMGQPAWTLTSVME